MSEGTEVVTSHVLDELPCPPERITHDVVVHALERHGWSVVGERSGFYRRLKKNHPSSRHSESVIVPTNTSHLDYGSAMHTALDQISRLDPEAWKWLSDSGGAVAKSLALIEATAGAGTNLDSRDLHDLVGSGLHAPASLSVEETMRVAGLLRDRSMALRNKAELLDRAAEIITDMAANGHRLGEMAGSEQGSTEGDDAL